MHKWKKRMLTGFLVFTMLFYQGNIFVWAGDADRTGVDTNVEVSEKNFPDQTFRNWISINIPGAGDGILSGSELAGITEIEIDGMSIRDLTGINYFANLKELQCERNELTALNLDNLIRLEELDCGNNQLGKLDVSRLTSLKDLDCDNNQLTSLDVTAATSLEDLDCSNNLLKTLEVKGLRYLEGIDCFNNQLETLDVSDLSALEDLSCYQNQLKVLDLRDSGLLEDLNCSSNQLESLKITGLKSLEDIDCSNNQLTSLDITGLYSLEKLICSYNNMTDTSDIKGYQSSSRINLIFDPQNKKSSTGSVTISSKETIAKGKTKTLTATMKTGNPGKVTWSSSNKKYVTVNSKGRIKGIRTGKATITARASNGKTATCKVTVIKKSVKAKSIRLNKKSVSLKTAKTYQLKPGMSPYNATDSIKWSSSNSKIAKVDANGIVTAVKKGSVTIKVRTTSGKKASCKVTVR